MKMGIKWIIVTSINSEKVDWKIAGAFIPNLGIIRCTVNGTFRLTEAYNNLENAHVSAPNM